MSSPPNPSTGLIYVLIHGAGDVGWYWHLVEAELRRRGHDVEPALAAQALANSGHTPALSHPLELVELLTPPRIRR